MKTDSPLLTASFIFGCSIVEKLEITKFNIRLWSGRAGLLAASQFPLVTALGTKHNVVACG